jgi:hypothetical protein
MGAYAVCPKMRVEIYTKDNTVYKLYTVNLIHTNVLSSTFGTNEYYNSTF